MEVVLPAPAGADNGCTSAPWVRTAAGVDGGADVIPHDAVLTSLLTDDSTPESSSRDGRSNVLSGPCH
jgi:hypothetical protein